MSFWTFCCKYPQVHRPFGASSGSSGKSQYPNTQTRAGTAGIPELDGCSDPSIDNEGDWICLSEDAGILSDGTLWCWHTDIVLIDNFKKGLDGALDRPVKISDDTDWTFVTASGGRGFAIKSDKSLWAFGHNRYGCAGIGIGMGFGNQGLYQNQYRARLSTGIKSVHSITTTNFGGTPTATVAGVQAGDTGSGATFSVEWSGAVRNIVVSSGGSYLSTPTATLVGTGADSGKTLAASSVTMSGPTTASFVVVSGGSGYTFATARSIATRATANAVIENGVIVGWTLTNQGSLPSQEYYDTLQNLYPVVVAGDGDGGVASLVLGPPARSVTAVSFPSTEMWTAVPDVVFSGGGGTGAVARLSSSGIQGTVKSITVTNPGTGYTQQPGYSNQIYITLTHSSATVVRGASVNLIPSTVNDIIIPVIPFGGLPLLLKQSDGKLFPFTASSVPAGTEVFIIKSDGSRINITPSGGGAMLNYSSPSIITGCTHPPFIRTYTKPAPLTATSPLRYYERRVPTNYCGTWPLLNTVYVTPGIEFGSLFPIADQSLSISGRGSAEYVNIEGTLVLVSQTRENIGQDDDSGSARAPRPQPPYPMYTVSRYTGRTSASTLNILSQDFALITRNWPQNASIYGSNQSRSVWTPPTLEQKARIYISPPEYGGESPYAEATPIGGDVVYGYGTSPTILSNGGGLYDIEPNTLTVTDRIEYPVRVGADSWKSVSMYGYSSYGVKDDGTLWWWGESTANGAGTTCNSPAPVGQGVTVDVTVDGDLRVDRMRGVIAFDVPSSGIYVKQDLRSIILVADESNNNAKFIQQGLRIKSSSFSTGVKYHPPERDVVTLSSSQFGLGYTSTPAIEYLHAGAPAATFTPRLVGPASFTEVSEDCAKASDGTWYRVGRMSDMSGLAPEPFVSGPQTEYNYVKTTTNPNTNDPDSITISTVRTIARQLWPTRISVTNGGSGYTTATISVAYNYRSPFFGADHWSYSNVVSGRNTVNCERFNNSTSTLYVVEVDTSRTDTLTVTRIAALNSASQSSVAITNGSIQPYTVAFHPVDTSSVQASISGDGAGAALSVSSQTQLIVSPMTPILGPGCESLLRTRGTCKNNNSLSILPYSNIYNSIRIKDASPKTYTVPRYQGVAKVDGWTFTDNNDRAFRLTSTGPPTDLAGVGGYRVFPAKLTVDSTGSGYGDVATATVSQQPGVAKATATYSGSVMAIGVLNAGHGYPSPPTVTLTTQDGVGTPGTAQAVIAGPVDKVSLTSGGSGYRIAPDVVFSGQGIHARATCTINSSGTVDTVRIEKGGRYRNTPPTVAFVPVKQVESLTLGAGGSHYTSAPDVYIGSGGGTGATATARINGVVEDITLLSGGAGYSEAPQVIIEGEATTAATASCRIKAKVVSIIVTNAGSGYKTKPTVSISGGGGSGATAEAVFELPEVGQETEIYSIQLTSQGDGYQTTPTVTITGGQGTGATARAVISGPVDSVSIQNQGQGYREQPLVIFSGGGGFGARATATMNGTVDQITLVNRGRDYVQPPEIVFYNGGGGSGATATATLSSPGSGAAGAAVLNGSIIFCTYSGSSGLQVEPIATVSHSANYVVAELSQRLSSGEITQAQYDTASATARARLKTRISGKVTGATIQTSGSLYEQTTSRNVRALSNPTSPAVAMIRDEMAEYTTGGKGDGRRAQYLFYGGHTELTGTVAGGSVTALTPSSSLSSWEFWRRPEVVMSDGISAIPQTCLILKAAAVRSGAAVNTGTIEPSGVKVNGVTAAKLPTDYKTSVDILSPSGQLLTTSGLNSGYSFNNSNGDSDRRFVASLYSPLPTVTVEDEAGTGATIGALGDTVIATGGSGYTLGARLVMKGGTPKSWSNKAVLEAVVTNGSVTAINITNGGLGYHEFPKILITGGGGTGATAIAYSGFPNNSVNLVVITNNGRGYTSTPTVVVIDDDKPAERLELDANFSGGGNYGAALRYEYGVDTVSTPVLTNYTIEFCMLSPTQSSSQMTIDSPVGLLNGRYGAQFAPFFEDDGYIEGVYWSFLNYNSYTPASGVLYKAEGYFCGNRDFVDVPTVTPVGGCSQPAVLTAQVVSWSNVSSDNALKKRD